MKKFEILGLNPQLIKGLAQLNIEQPTEIQEKAIPELLKAERDFIGLAQTGTGKTAAFGLPLLQLVDVHQKHLQGLIITPTRELGQQVAQQLALYGKFMKGLEVQVVYGGKPIHQQIKRLRSNPQIVVATPGRLLDLLMKKALHLKGLRHLVLDEADEMLNMGFQEDIDKILKYTPQDKITWLFSATMPKEIKTITHQYMTNPVEVSVKPNMQVNDRINHAYVGIKSGKKTEALLEIVDQSPDMRAVVFCRTRRDTRDLAKHLMRAKVSADALHGDLSQGQRDKVMRQFKSQRLQLLIATDVAARGIDVSDLTHVIHYTLPDDLAFYTHRSGRTARAGKEGTSLALVSRGDMKKVYDLQKSLNIQFASHDAFEESEWADNTSVVKEDKKPSRRGNGNGGGQNRYGKRNDRNKNRYGRSNGKGGGSNGNWKRKEGGSSQPSASGRNRKRRRIQNS